MYLIITIRIFFIHIQSIIVIIIIIIRHFLLKISKLFFEYAIREGFTIHFTTFMENFLIWL